jgi:hypothetical protein
MEQLPHEQVRPDLTPTLLLVGRVGAFDLELLLADRARDEARPHVVAAQLLAKRGIGDSESYWPQFCRGASARGPEPAHPRPRAFPETAVR